MNKLPEWWHKENTTMICFRISNGDGGVEVFRIYDHYFIFETPPEGGKPRLENIIEGDMNKVIKYVEEMT